MIMEHSLFSNEVKFHQVSQQDDCSSSVSEDRIPHPLNIKQSLYSYLSLLVSGLLLTLTISLTFSIGRSWDKGSFPCLPYEEITKYSPFLEDVPLTYKKVQFNGSLLKTNVYRQDAGPEVDAAWEALGVSYRSIAVPIDLAEKSGLLQDQVKMNQQWGGGFPANIEGLHHLHCLNLLRQTSWYNYEYYHKKREGAFVNNDFILKMHASHCLDILRQQLMCTVDIGVLGQVWVNPKAPMAFVDFNTKHICRDFEAVRTWAEARQLPEDVSGDFLQPPSAGDMIYAEIP